MAPRPNPMTVSRLVPPTPASLPTTAVAPQPTPVDRKGKHGVAVMPRLFDTSCDETVCSADSFCVSDYTWGGSRCHCNLGKGGESCSEGGCMGEWVGIDATATWARGESCSEGGLGGVGGERGGELTLQGAIEQYFSPRRFLLVLFLRGALFSMF